MSYDKEIVKEIFVSLLYLENSALKALLISFGPLFIHSQNSMRYAQLVYPAGTSAKEAQIINFLFVDDRQYIAHVVYYFPNILKKKEHQPRFQGPLVLV